VLGADQRFLVFEISPRHRRASFFLGFFFFFLAQKKKSKSQKKRGGLFARRVQIFSKNAAHLAQHKGRRPVGIAHT
jgi:hypothetical protein